MEVPSKLSVTDIPNDKTILTMLSANKNFNDEKFFERVLDNRYPLLKKFKRPDESWKVFYLRMIYYIALLEEKYGIPYIPNKDYDPETFYNKNKDTENIYNTAMTTASKGGHVNIVKLMIEKGATDFDVAMSTAARAGNLEIVKLLKQYMNEKSDRGAIAEAIEIAEDEDPLDILLHTNPSELAKICSENEEFVEICRESSFINKYGEIWGFVRLIEGPMEYYEIKIGEKRTYIFGDQHTIDEKDKCDSLFQPIPIEDLIEIMVEETGQIDVFLEVDFFPKEQDIKREKNLLKFEHIGDREVFFKAPDYLVKVFRKFRECLQYDKEECSKMYPGARFHWADIRKGIIFNQIKELLRLFMDFMMKGKPENQKEKLYKKLEEDEKDILGQINIDSLLEETRITKQLSKTNFETADTIRSFFIPKMEALIKEASRVFEKGLFVKVLMRLTDFMHLFMDMYIVSRMFKNLNVPMENIVIYVGSLHARSIKDFLLSLPKSELVNSKVNEDRKPKLQCLEMRVRKPFF